MTIATQLLAPQLEAFLARGEAVAVVVVAISHGSTPRERGATMLVGKTALHGTIGGGQLEFHSVDKARDMLASGADALTLPVVLGPQMGQCCGGRVVLEMRRADVADVAVMAARDAALLASCPSVLVFGAGHTGRALAAQLGLLPLRIVLVDDRPEEMALLTAQVETRLLTDPEMAIHDAPPGSAFVVMTHSHALDYRLAEAALRRGDAAYVGMIGSATKRARFVAGLKRDAAVTLAAFACPVGGQIGGNSVADKRPEIIAALTVAEIVCALFGKQGKRHEDDAPVPKRAASSLQNALQAVLKASDACEDALP
jgi:xanthine dehydrogenase accessory factor